MAVSGSFDYNNTVTEIIDDALEYAGLRDRNQTTTADVAQTCVKTFNYMLKYWQTLNIGLWLIDDITLFLQKSTLSYDIYAGGANATTSFVKTEIATAASSTATQVILDSVTGFGDTYDRDGIITATTPTGSGAITLSGTLVANSVATLSSERKILIYSDGDDSGVTFAVNGKNSLGTVVSETITGPNTTSVYSTKEYSTITSISISGAGTGNIEVGQVGDHLGIELDGGSLQWTNIIGTPNTTQTIADALTDDVNVDANVYTYTKKAQKPLEIIEARLMLDGATEYPINIRPRSEYKYLSDKDSTGKCTQLYQDARIDRMTAYTWPVATIVKDYIKMSAKRRIDDVDELTDNVALPPEALLMVATNLAYWIGPKFGVNAEKMMQLKGLASETLQAFMMYDQEGTSFTVSLRDY